MTEKSALKTVSRETVKAVKDAYRVCPVSNPWLLSEPDVGVLNIELKGPLYEGDWHSLDYQSFSRKLTPTSSRRSLSSIQGEPKSGKTFLVHQLCSDYATDRFAQDTTLVLRFLLHCLSSLPSLDLKDLLFAISSPSSGSTPPLSDEQMAEIVDYMQSSDGEGILLILDGLDDLPAHLRQQSIIRDIIEGKQLSKASIIVTARKETTVRSLVGVDQKFHLYPIDADKFASWYFKKCEGENAERVTSFLRVNCQLADYTTHPVPLSMICFVLHHGREPPTTVTITQIINAAICLLATQNLKRTGNSTEMKNLQEVEKFFPSIIRLYQKALDSVIEKKSTFKETQSFDSEESLGLIVCRHSSRHAGEISQSFQFADYFVQQFLAACALSKQPEEDQVSFWEERLCPSHGKHGRCVIAKPPYHHLFPIYCGITHLQSKPIQQKLLSFLSASKEGTLLSCNWDQLLLPISHAAFESGNEDFTHQVATHIGPHVSPPVIQSNKWRYLAWVIKHIKGIQSLVFQSPYGVEDVVAFLKELDGVRSLQSLDFLFHLVCLPEAPPKENLSAIETFVNAQECIKSLKFLMYPCTGDELPSDKDECLVNNGAKQQIASFLESLCRNNLSTLEVFSANVKCFKPKNLIDGDEVVELLAGSQLKSLTLSGFACSQSVMLKVMRELSSLSSFHLEDTDLKASSKEQTDEFVGALKVATAGHPNLKELHVQDCCQPLTHGLVCANVRGLSSLNVDAPELGKIGQVDLPIIQSMTELLRSGSLDKLSVGMLPDYSPEVAGFFQQVASSHLGEFSMRGLAADEELIFGGNHYEEGRILTIKDLTKCPKELASAIESGIGGCRTLKKLRATHCDTLLLPCVKGVVSNGNIEELFFTSMLNVPGVLLELGPFMKKSKIASLNVDRLVASLTESVEFLIGALCDGSPLGDLTMYVQQKDDTDVVQNETLVQITDTLAKNTKLKRLKIFIDASTPLAEAILGGLLHNASTSCVDMYLTGQSLLQSQDLVDRIRDERRDLKLVVTHRGLTL